MAALQRRQAWRGGGHRVRQRRAGRRIRQLGELAVGPRHLDAAPAAVDQAAQVYFCCCEVSLPVHPQRNGPRDDLWHGGAIGRRGVEHRGQHGGHGRRHALHEHVEGQLDSAVVGDKRWPAGEDSDAEHSERPHVCSLQLGPRRMRAAVQLGCVQVMDWPQRMLGASAGTASELAPAERLKPDKLGVVLRIEERVLRPQLPV
eukprot:scaffold1203_cov74-Phaeocystis_antarctica.AAC.6